MSRVLLTWEMGGGYGHLVRLRAFAEPLIAAGHEVTFALHELRLAPRYLEDLDARWLAAPSGGVRSPKPLALKSFPEILLMQGFNSVENLFGRMRAWEGIYDLVQPDLVIYDHSATAMLAFRGRDARQVAVGTGFFNPPRVSPYPLLRPWMKVNPEQLVQMEERVLGIANGAAERAGVAPLGALHELFDLHSTALLSYPEIDHYADLGVERTGADFWGIPPNPEGPAPEWPAGDGPRIFAYLKPFKTLPALLDALKQRGAPTVVHIPNIPPKLRQRFEGSNVVLTDQPVDIEAAASEAEVCICNGGHGTVATMLLAGTPMLILPQHLEQMLMAKRLETLGVATVAPKLQPGGMNAGLEKLLSETSFRDAAQSFAKAHKRNTAAGFEKKVKALAKGL